MATYRANVTDKEQTDLERAENDSAIRVFWFDGGHNQIGKVKMVPALDLQRNLVATPKTDAIKRYGHIVGSHNDRPWL